MKEREITAHHEAGHVAIAYALNVPVDCVTIIPHEGRSGGIWHHKTNPEKEILITMAGPFAEAQFTSKTARFLGDDAAGVKDAMAILPGSIEYYEEATKHLVQKNWIEIEAIANELLISSGVLCGAQLNQIILCARLDSFDME